MSRATVPRTRSTASVRIFATRRGGVAGEVRAGGCLRPPQAQTYSDEEEGDTTLSIEEAKQKCAVASALTEPGVRRTEVRAGEKRLQVPSGRHRGILGKLGICNKKKRTSFDVRFGGVAKPDANFYTID